MTNNGGVLDTPPEDELAAVCASGDNERVAELLAFGVDPNSRIGHDSYIAVASRAGNHVALSRLIRAGGKVSRPMLRDAIAGGNPRCADKVLDELLTNDELVDISFPRGLALLAFASDRL